MENTDVILQNLYQQFKEDGDFRVLKKLDSEYFIMGSESMEMIKSAVQDFLSTYTRAMAEAENDKEASAARSAFKYYDAVFEEIVRDKRRPLLEKDILDATIKIEERMAFFPTFTAPKAEAKSALLKTGIESKIGFQGVKILESLPAKFWTDQALYNAVLHTVAGYLLGFKEKLDRPLNIKEIYAVIHKFNREYEAFERISAEKREQAEREAQEARDEFKGSCGRNVKSMQSRINRIGKKFYRQPESDLTDRDCKR